MQNCRNDRVLAHEMYNEDAVLELPIGASASLGAEHLPRVEAPVGHPRTRRSEKGGRRQSAERADVQAADADQVKAQWRWTTPFPKRRSASSSSFKREHGPGAPGAASDHDGGERNRWSSSTNSAAIA
jgi:hypothetical protein